MANYNSALFPAIQDILNIITKLNRHLQFIKLLGDIRNINKQTEMRHVDYITLQEFGNKMN